MRSYDFPYAEQMAERFKKMLPPNIADDEEGSDKMPPQVAQAMQAVEQAQQQVAQQAEELAKVRADIETETKKLEADKAGIAADKKSVDADKKLLDISRQAVMNELNSKELEMRLQQSEGERGEFEASAKEATEVSEQRLEQLKAGETMAMTALTDAIAAMQQSSQIQTAALMEALAKTKVERKVVSMVAPSGEVYTAEINGVEETTDANPND
jgi:hypothetical protein